MNAAALLTPLRRRFVLQWSDVGTRSGLSPSAAKVQALLIVAGRAVDAEKISRALSLSRSSVSNGLRELLGAGLIRLVRVLGDRHDRFEIVKDSWELGRRILEERKRRVVDPALGTLRGCLEESARAGRSEASTRECLEELLEFYEFLGNWIDQVCSTPRGRSPRRAGRPAGRNGP
jgi:DNA-binding transcriptional regulator GbsR (MarR family)